MPAAPICRAVLCTTLLSLAAVPAAATPAGALSVAVVDPQGLAVRGATVSLAELNREAVTEADGAAHFDTLADGAYTLVVIAPAFDPVTEFGVRVPAGLTRYVTIRLQQLRARGTQVDVVGESEQLIRQVPGSVELVTIEEIRASHSFDAADLLRRVPGLTVREDSGPAGMRLNIGVRGLNPDRSRQVLVLEDGLPLALAPYGEPEMYYSPPIERMQRIEILKGSGSILYGPQTVGGVVNFVTPDPPARPRASLDLLGGNDGLFSALGSFGTTAGRLGVFVSGLHKRADGFRALRYDITDLTSKATVALRDGHSLGVKVQGYTEDSNSTYLGLTQAQFETNPNQNLVPDDRLKVRRLFGSAHHRAILGGTTPVSTTFFMYDTQRFWRRSDYDRQFSASRRYIASGGNPLLPGGAVWVRETSSARDREFLVAGVETRVARDHALFGVRQSFEGGGHYLFERAEDRRVDYAQPTGGTGTVREDENRPAHAVTVFAQNRLFLGDRVTVTPGVRAVRYSYDRHITRQRVGGVPTAVDIRGGDELTEFVPGLGATFSPSLAVTLFGGAHRGFAPPRVKDAITSTGESLLLDAERSWNYEAGARWAPRAGLHASATFFVLDFTNQIIPAAQSGGATTTLINGGETLHRGFELAGAVDVADRLPGSETVNVELRYAWLEAARFTSGLHAGHRLPYAPESTLTLMLTYRDRSGFGVQADGTYLSAQFGDNTETVPGSADGTIGRVPAYAVWNLAVDYRFAASSRLTLTPFVSVKNVTDRVYIASRAPEGIQPGPHRRVVAGVRTVF